MAQRGSTNLCRMGLRLMSRGDDLKRLFGALFGAAPQARGHFVTSESQRSSVVDLTSMSGEEREVFNLLNIFEVLQLFWILDESSDGEAEVRAVSAHDAIETFVSDLSEPEGRSIVLTLRVRDRHGDHLFTKRVVIDPPVPCKGGEWVSSKEAGPFYADHGGIKYHSMCSCPKRHQRTESSGMTDPATGLRFEGIIYHDDGDYFSDDEDDEDDRYGSR